MCVTIVESSAKNISLLSAFCTASFFDLHNIAVELRKIHRASKQAHSERPKIASAQPSYPVKETSTSLKTAMPVQKGLNIMQDIAAVVGEFVKILFLAVQEIAVIELLFLPIYLDSIEYNLHGHYIAGQISKLERCCFAFGDDLG